jgi:hypothetical protein
MKNPSHSASFESLDKDAPSKAGIKPRSTVLSVKEEAVVVVFRKHTLLPLDGCLYALQVEGEAEARRLGLATGSSFRPAP